MNAATRTHIRRSITSVEGQIQFVTAQLSDLKTKVEDTQDILLTLRLEAAELREDLA